MRLTRRTSTQPRSPSAEAFARSPRLAEEQGSVPRLLVADLNGTDFRASDWGYALVHLRDRLGEFEADLWLPAESFGETGAATGGVSLCMVFEAARRGLVPGSAASLILCADGGGRSCLLIETPASAG